MDRKNIEKIITGLKFCPQWNTCEEHQRCKNEKQNILNLNSEHINYIMRTMEEHDLSISDLERLVVAYKKYFQKHSEDEETLVGKISKIYYMLDLENTVLPIMDKDICPLI